MRWKQIIWDWNGTLINDVHLCLDIINSVLAKYNKPRLTLQQYHNVFDFPVKDYYRRIGFDFDETPFEIVGTEFMDLYRQRWKTCDLHKGVVRLAGAFNAVGAKQIILSAAETSLLQAGVDHFDLSHFFTELLGLNHHYATSKEKLVVDFVARAGIAPKEILFIGDTTHDYFVAQKVGVECILFSGGHHPKEKLKKYSAPVFESFNEMQKHIFLE